MESEASETSEHEQEDVGQGRKVEGVSELA